LQNIKPAYGQKTFDLNDRKNKWQVVVSPDSADQGLNINQDARFSLTDLKAGSSISYRMKWKNSGLYVFVIGGEIKIGSQSLSLRDALGITDTENVVMEAASDSQVLAIEIPME
jgi:redox-sensitive bicupin YhaK (pirin superfamily)